MFVVAFGTSVGTVFFNPAAGSVLPALVRTDALIAANSGIWTAAVLSQIALAPLAGLVVLTAGFPTGFAVNAASYLLSGLPAAATRASSTGTAGASAPAARRGRRDAAPAG